MLRAGFTVFGQEPTGWLRHELKHRQLHKHTVATPPAHIDLVCGELLILLNISNSPHAGKTDALEK
jgi:hypothetical protein